MTTITIDNVTLKKTNFENVVDLYDYLVENQLLTEIWNVDEESLSENSKLLLKKSRKHSHLINI